MKTKQLVEGKVFAYMQEHHMLAPHDRVVVGVSGGADSVCLLFVLLEWAKRTPLQLAVVHVNHGIRREAVDDAAYVEALCKAHELPFYLIEEDVPRRAALEKCSEEEAGRRVRYEAFARVAEELGACKIAVAHNSNDRSETMLFHLFRGSGIKGLGSIQPVRDNIIRPILCLERREIEAYLTEQGIAYCQDATNNTDDYTRNRIRHHILPYAEKEIARGSVRHMAQTAEQLSEIESYLEQQTAVAMEQCVSAAYQISVTTLLQQHPTIQKRLLHELVKALSPEQKDISYVHIQDLLDLFTGEGNRMVNLPFGICGRREYTKVILENVNLQSDISNISLLDSVEMCTKVLPYCGKTQELPQNEYTKWFDYDKIKGCLELRCRQTGDYLTISDGRGGMRHKSLKDYMIDKKIPRAERDMLPVLAEGNHVLWLPGYRISEYYKISGNTNYILQVQLIGKKPTDGETEDKNG